jgi:hypothetical protein
VRFGYGNQLLAFLGLSHWLLVAVLDLLGFPTNFYERHYLLLLVFLADFTNIRPSLEGANFDAVILLKALSTVLLNLPAARLEGRLVPIGFCFPIARGLLSPLYRAIISAVFSPSFGLEPDAAFRPARKGEVFLLDGAAFLAFGLPCPGLGSEVLGTLLRGAGIYSS